MPLSNVPAGMVQQVDARRGELAADFLQRFESTSEKDAMVYFNDIRSNDRLVPARFSSGSVSFLTGVDLPEVRAITR
jgi:hypothetical protein